MFKEHSAYDKLENHPGWVELNGLRFISDVTAVAPVEPYVKGVQDEDGKFYPDKPYTIVGKTEH